MTAFGLEHDHPTLRAGRASGPEAFSHSGMAARDPYARILAVEGDEDALGKLTAALSLAGAVLGATSVADARRVAGSADLDLVVMDINLQDDSGLGLVRWLRKNTRARIIVHSARQTVGDRVEAYVQGADVFLPKPAPTAELVALARSLVARRAGGRLGSLEEPGWRLDSLGNLVTPSGRSVMLTIRQRLLMERLMRGRGDIVGRDELRQIVGTRKTDKSGRSLDMFICRLRKAVMEQAGEEAPILVVHGKGFSFSNAHPPAASPE